jgi:hypothetical protein
MKRIVVTSLLLFCMVLPASLMARDKKPSVDMSNMNRIFLGWIDLDPDALSLYGHSNGDASSKADWIDVDRSLNSIFQRNCQSKYLPGRTITAAKDRGDESAAGNDLYVKFTDVSVDIDKYRLSLSIHFIDPTTNSEIASIPLRKYSERACNFLDCLRGELSQVGSDLQEKLRTDRKRNK